MFISLANEDVLGTEPMGLLPACLAYEPAGPLDTGQIGDSCNRIDVSEPLVKFDFGFRNILGNCKIGHGGIFYCV